MSRQTVREEEEEGQPDRFIVLLRHGIAEDKTEEKPDQDRSLTSEGHARMKQIARGLERVFPKAQIIYSSPYLRASQTALWISKGYRSRVKIKPAEVLAPGSPPRAVYDFLQSIQERKVVVVGHEPILTNALMELIGAGVSGRFELKKGGCYGIRLRADGTAVFEWLLSPRVLTKLGEAD